MEESPIIYSRHLITVYLITNANRITSELSFWIHLIGRKDSQGILNIFFFKECLTFSVATGQQVSRRGFLDTV